VGFYLEFKPVRWINFEGKFMQSYIFGKAILKGDFTDIDDMQYFTTGTSTVTGTEYDYGTAPFRDKESIAVPVTELDINVVFPVKAGLKIRLGGFVSHWNGLPLAPNFEYVDKTVSRYPVWHTRKESLFFNAIGTLLTVELKF
jgi:hypothetical protein